MENENVKYKLKLNKYSSTEKNCVVCLKSPGTAGIIVGDRAVLN
jgi:hypothetical protein